jgi:hypothetical protein
MMKYLSAAAVLGVVLLCGNPALAATPEQKYQAVKNQAAGFITPGTSDQTIPLGYHDGTGTVAGNAALVASNIKLGVNIFGVAGTLGCGNGLIDAGEQCDQSNLNGDTCASVGYTAGTLTCGADCILYKTGCYAVRFTDNGNGTVTDAQTGLM